LGAEDGDVGGVGVELSRVGFDPVDGGDGVVAGADSYDYDAAGNTTTRDIGNADQTLSWDIEGHLAATADSTGNTSYAYDAGGGRLLRRDPTSTTVYLPNMELRLDKTTGKVAGTRYYDHGGSLVAVNTGGTIQFQSADPHGTAELSINASTQALAQRRFTPFGQFRGSPTGIWPTDKGFVGGTIDPSGLTNLGARQYDPNTGRFISVDPIFDAKDPQSWNGYAYADNNPTTASDPSGLDGPLRGNTNCYYANIGCGSGGSSQSGGSTRGGGGSPPVRHSCNWWCHTKNVGNAAVDEVLDPFVSFYGQLPRDIAGGTAALACSEGDQSACGMATQFPYAPPPDTHIPLGGDTSSPEYKITRLIVRYAPLVLGGVGAARAGLRAGAEAGLRAGLEGGARAGEEEVAARPSVTGCINSFVAGTPVLLANGKQKPIEKIKPGDKVLATDPATGQTHAEPVIASFGGTNYKKLIKITVDTDGERGHETGVIIATEHHKFWNPAAHAWTRADHLNRRATVRTATGKTVHVVSMTRYPGHPSVHDLTIARLHTYYVEAGTIPILVHNDGDDDLVRVGRWMSQAEYDAMERTGMVQRGAGGYSYVVYPANKDAYKSARPGSVYAEYDVPHSSLIPGGRTGDYKMSDSSTMYSRLRLKKGLPPYELPEAKNLNLGGGEVC
jgi:RHS repeat-associated protein